MALWKAEREVVRLQELVLTLMRHHEMQREAMDGDCVGCQNMDHSTRPITEEDARLAQQIERVFPKH